ncbi:hypothetical protein [Sediminibacterium sp.]|uniref:hypothetical protein n=1 Tax=Sediminibacterium sp. TaxID=1917865 RepID=UPI0027368C3F|nr:hypothetical protein [Sediminibacterium sp.]MDP3395007.1 hypothetical protein [Sediminibacterium sp.]MDP3565634.1 hypothetical protein [Sediminibacterium sp.]
MLKFETIESSGTNASCNKCGISTWVTNYMEGTEEGERVTYWGFQCLTCGNIETGKARETETNGGCRECGGILSRKEPIKCPACLGSGIVSDKVKAKKRFLLTIKKGADYKIPPLDNKIGFTKEIISSLLSLNLILANIDADGKDIVHTGEATVAIKMLSFFEIDPSTSLFEYDISMELEVILKYLKHLRKEQIDWLLVCLHELIVYDEDINEIEWNFMKILLNNFGMDEEYYFNCLLEATMTDGTWIIRGSD